MGEFSTEIPHLIGSKNHICFLDGRLLLRAAMAMVNQNLEDIRFYECLNFSLPLFKKSQRCDYGNE